MNKELVDKLVEQATENRPYKLVNSDGEVVVSTDNYGVNLQKFAELIVKECMNSIYVEQDNETCIDDWDFRYEAGLASAILCIENHFEIEL